MTHERELDEGLLSYARDLVAAFEERRPTPSPRLSDAEMLKIAGVPDMVRSDYGLSWWSQDKLLAFGAAIQDKLGGK